MDVTTIARAIFSLVLVLGLILGLSTLMRRYAPEWLAKLHSHKPQRRMQMVETLVLDPARRLVMIKIDGTERLLLLGDGHDLGPLTKKELILTEERPLERDRPIIAPPARSSHPLIKPTKDPTEDLF
jgi:flagellar protein FliO/FliZ